MRVVAVGLLGRDADEDYLEPEDRGLARARLGRCDRLPDRVDFFIALLHRKPLRAVGLVALGHVLREGVLGMAIDCRCRPKRNQLPQAEVPT